MWSWLSTRAVAGRHHQRRAPEGHVHRLACIHGVHRIPGAGSAVPPIPSSRWRPRGNAQLIPAIRRDLNREHTACDPPLRFPGADPYRTPDERGDRTTQLLDSLPIIVVFGLLIAATFIVFEIGFRVGRWYQERTPGEQEGPTGVLVGSLLALLAFLLAVTMSMAADRFDNRRGLVLDEANAIGTTYLRAGYLPEPVSSESRALLREYVSIRINTPDRAPLADRIRRSEEIQDALWVRAEGLAIAHPDFDAYGLYIETVNELIDVSAARITGGLTARVPETIIWLLILGSMLTMAMVGYSAGLTGRRAPLGAVVLIVALVGGARPRPRPRPAPGRIHPDQPAAADRAGAGDRFAIAGRRHAAP